MEPITKPNVSLTLRVLEVGDSVSFNLSEVTEPNVRSVCSRISSSLGCQFMIERRYPKLYVTKTI